MVTDIKNKTSAGNELSSFACTYDLNGRKVSEEDSVKTVNDMALILQGEGIIRPFEWDIEIKYKKKLKKK